MDQSYGEQKQLTGKIFFEHFNILIYAVLLQVIDFGMANFMAIVEKAVQFGQPVLLQNILETIDPSINPILSKAIVKQGGQFMIKVCTAKLL